MNPPLGFTIGVSNITQPRDGRRTSICAALTNSRYGQDRPTKRRATSVSGAGGVVRDGSTIRLPHTDSVASLPAPIRLGPLKAPHQSTISDSLQAPAPPPSCASRVGQPSVQLSTHTSSSSASSQLTGGAAHYGQVRPGVVGVAPVATALHMPPNPVACTTTTTTTVQRHQHHHTFPSYHILSSYVAPPAASYRYSAFTFPTSVPLIPPPAPTYVSPSCTTTFATTSSSSQTRPPYSILPSSLPPPPAFRSSSYLFTPAALPPPSVNIGQGLSSAGYVAAASGSGTASVYKAVSATRVDPDDGEYAETEDEDDEDDDDDDDEEWMQWRWECFLAEQSEWVAFDDTLSAHLDYHLRVGAAFFRFFSRGYVYEINLQSSPCVQVNTVTGKERPLRRICEVVVDVIDESFGNAAVVWPFSEPENARLVHFSVPKRSVIDFTVTIEKVRKEGFGNDVRFWSSRLYACEFGGRLGQTALALVEEDSEEWGAVQQRFSSFVRTESPSMGGRVTVRHKGMADSLRSVFRVQNAEHMEKYSVRRSSMLRSLTKTNTDPEEVLWHGPSSLKSLEGIVSRGFDRMFACKGANAYGMGLYFATDALMADKYSCTLYSEPDGQMCQAMLLAKVLVGEYCQGNKDMYPPPLKPGSTDPYDTTVNTMIDPSIFVTYQDHQAMPLYVITYTHNTAPLTPSP